MNTALKGTHLFSDATDIDSVSEKISASPLKPSRLWLALYLPRFPLEVLGAQRTAVLPVAVIAGIGADTVVVAVDTDAARAGVHAGKIYLVFRSTPK